MQLHMAHDQELAALKIENERLHKELWTWTSTPATAPLRAAGSFAGASAEASLGTGSGRSSSVVASRWDRFACALLAKASTINNVQRASQQQHVMGYTRAGSALDALALRLGHNGGECRGEILQAFSEFRSWTSEVRAGTAFWRSAAASMRNELVMACSCDEGSTRFEDVEAALQRMLGERWQQDQQLKSLLLHAYEQLFPGIRDAKTKSRRRKKTNKSAAVSADARLTDSAAEDVAVTVEDQVSQLQGGTAPVPVFTLSSAIVVNNTFIDVVEEQSCGGRESTKSWPVQVRPRSTQQRVNTLVKNISGCGLPQEQCSANLQNLLVAARSCASDLVALMKVVDAVAKVAGPRFWAEVQPLLHDIPPQAVAECCTLATQGDHGRPAADDIVVHLSATMHKCIEDVSVQHACLDSVLIMCRSKDMVLGLFASRAPACDNISADLRTQLTKAVTSAMRYPECGSNALRVLARILPLAQVLKSIGSSMQFLSVVLDEIYYALTQPLHDFSGTTDSSETDWAKRLLLEVTRQRPASWSGPCPVSWVRAATHSGFGHTHRDDMERRFMLVGVLCGVGPGIITPFVDAAATMDEYLLCTAYRALIAINDDLERIDAAHVRSVVEVALRIEAVCLKYHHCSAMVGALGSLMRKTADQVVAQKILAVARARMGDCWKGASFLYEVLWALVELFKDHPCLGECEPGILEIAGQVMQTWNGAFEGHPDSDEQKAVLFAKKLLGWHVGKGD